MTPSDLLPAKLTQPQIDELAQRQPVADVLPLTPLQQGLLFHSLFVPGPRTCTRCSWTSPWRGHWIGIGCAKRCTVVGRHPNLAARFCDQFGEPVQVLAADPDRLAVDLRGNWIPGNSSIGCARRGTAVCDPIEQPTFRGR